MTGMIDDEDNNDGSKSLIIKTDDDGKMSMDFDGEYKLYEVFGILTVTMADMFVKNFMVPYMNEQSVKIVEHLKNTTAEPQADINNGIKDVAELNLSVKKIMSLVNQFKGIQDTPSSGSS